METALFENHQKLQAKLVDFCGWQMPLQYKGIIQEHHNVRDKVGIFDVSHMGKISIQGKEAEKFLDYLSTNKIAGKEDLSATYTLWCQEDGGVIDDLIIYKQDSHHFFVIVNACNRQKDLQHLQERQKGFDVQIKPHFDGEGILAVQGPLAFKVLSPLFPNLAQLKPMHFYQAPFLNESVIISQTGYTGAGGYEIYASDHLIVPLWDLLLEQGKPFDIMPIGLGARDTLRLEMGYALYGHELTEQTAGNETISAWTIKWAKQDFLGKSAMQALEKSGKRNAYGLLLLEAGIARQGYPVVKEGITIGQVTSGTFSPTLNQAIALILVEGCLNIGEQVEIEIRDKLVKAKVVDLPFIRIRAL